MARCSDQASYLSPAISTPRNSTDGSVLHALTGIFVPPDNDWRVAHTPNRPVSDLDSLVELADLFQQPGATLERGDRTDAREALAQLQKNALPRIGQADDAIRVKVELPQKALDSDDLKAAQGAYADIKSLAVHHIFRI